MNTPNEKKKKRGHLILYKNKGLISAEDISKRNLNDDIVYEA